MNNEKYMSLYDFLKRPAGPDLGKKVAAAAVEQKIKLQEQQVSTKNYTGKILTYPVSFLENYFSANTGKILLTEKQQFPNSDYKEYKDLPF